MAFLYDYQWEAVNRLKDGNILVGSVGSGKSRTGLYYYFKEYGGDFMTGDKLMENPANLLIITTAQKRDLLEWEEEMMPYFLSTDEKVNCYNNKVVVDSWHNIKKYKNLRGWFIIFDEQHAINSGAWSWAFLRMAKNNRWILLTATPADTYIEYLYVFIANGFFKSKTEFINEHVVYSRWVKYKIDRYINTTRLDRLRSRVEVVMNYKHEIEFKNIDIWCDYDVKYYKDIIKNRFNYEKGEPFTTASDLFFYLRKISNSDPSRAEAVKDICKKHPRAIIFYSFDYELDILRNIDYSEGVEVAELNGHKHQPVPDGPQWVYLVNYTSGAEAWSCILTDTIIFYSQTYSYKTLTQAKGRIDRLTTPYDTLYYYHLRCKSGIDISISKALQKKKKFNERSYFDKNFR